MLPDRPAPQHPGRNRKTDIPHSSPLAHSRFTALAANVRARHLPERFIDGSQRLTEIATGYFISVEAFWCSIWSYCYAESIFSPAPSSSLQRSGSDSAGRAVLPRAAAEGDEVLQADRQPHAHRADLHPAKDCESSDRKAGPGCRSATASIARRTAGFRRRA